jgi:hypothetical protein
LVAYSYNSEFAVKVESGEKQQTIRPERKNGHAEPGDTIQLYENQRTKKRRQIGEAICTANLPIVITEHEVRVEGKLVEDQDAFARADGYRNFGDLKAWFTKQYGPLPFVGLLIVWQTLVLQAA